MKLIFGSCLLISLMFFISCSKNKNEIDNNKSMVQPIEKIKIDYDRALPEKRIIYMNELTQLFDATEIFPDTVIKKFATTFEEAAKYHQHYAARLMVNNKDDLAISEAKRALVYKPDYVVVYVMIADCYRIKNMKDSAYYYINNALALDSSDLAAKLMKRDIDCKFKSQQRPTDKANIKHL